MHRKVVKVIIMGALLISILSSCDKNINQEQDAVVMTPFYEEAYNETQIIYDRDDVANWYCEIYDARLVYLNYGSDYEITLPLNWKNNFRVVSNKKGSSVFFFWGKSDVGYIPSEGKYGGLYFFSIVPESALEGATLDGVAYIGSANGINYYYATHTDCEICALREELEDYEAGISIYQDDPEQIELIREDYETVQKMREDFDYRNLDFQPME